MIIHAFVLYALHGRLKSKILTLALQVPHYQVQKHTPLEISLGYSLQLNLFLLSVHRTTPQLQNRELHLAHSAVRSYR